MDIGYSHIMKFDHDFIGREALEKKLDQPHKKKVTLLWNSEDVVRVFESVRHSDGRVLAKVYRRFRLDGPRRALVSFVYNRFMRLLWPKLGLSDVNGSPKMAHVSVIRAMQLQSRDWMLDAEMMIKAQAMGLKVIEMNVFARMREHGESKVVPSTVLTFIAKLLAFRFGPEIRRWRREWEADHSLDEVGVQSSRYGATTAS